MYAAVDPYTETHAISISFAYFFSLLRKKRICMFMQMRFFHFLQFFGKKTENLKKHHCVPKKLSFTTKENALFFKQS